VGGIGLYFAYDRLFKPGLEMAASIKELATLADIEKQVRNTARVLILTAEKPNHDRGQGLSPKGRPPPNALTLGAIITLPFFSPAM
jgi:hypothetical protein